MKTTMSALKDLSIDNIENIFFLDRGVKNSSESCQDGEVVIALILTCFSKTLVGVSAHFEVRL